MPVPTVSEPLDGSTRALADLVFDRLAELIISGKLEQREKLRDQDIAQWLGVSRTPVREAINRLVHVGLVESEPSRYTRVTTVDPSIIQKTFEFTGYMAGISVRMAMANMNQDQTCHSISLLDAMIEASDHDHAESLYKKSREFIGYMISNSGNEVFMRAMGEAAVATERNLRQMRPQIGSPAERRKSYLLLRSALIEKNPDEAERALREQHQIF